MTDKFRWCELLSIESEINDLLESERGLLRRLNNILSENEERTNIFKIFSFRKQKGNKVTEKESRYSDMLAWLLDSKRPDGISEKFLRPFLREVEKSEDSKLEKGTRKFLEKIDGEEYNFKEANVRREKHREVAPNEKRRADLWIEIPEKSSDNKAICVVENKIRDSFDKGKLQAYKREAEEESSSGSYLCIALSPDRELTEIPKGYVMLTYEEVLEALENLSKSDLKRDQKIIINHYQNALRRLLEKMPENLEEIVNDLKENGYEKVAEAVKDYSEESPELSKKEKYKILEIVMKTQDWFDEDRWLISPKKGKDWRAIRISKEGWGWKEKEEYRIFFIIRLNNQITIDCMFQKYDDGSKKIREYDGEAYEVKENLEEIFYKTLEEKDDWKIGENKLYLCKTSVNYPRKYLEYSKELEEILKKIRLLIEKFEDKIDDRVIGVIN